MGYYIPYSQFSSKIESRLPLISFMWIYTMNLRYVWQRCLNGEVSTKWNVHDEQEVFLRLGLLWGFSEHVLYLDNYMMLFCFLRIDYFVFFTRYSLRYLPKKLYISSIKLLLLYSVWCSLSLSDNLFVLARRIKPFVIWAKPFGCYKLLNKEIFNSLAHAFYIFVFRFAKIWQTTETYSPQTISVMAAVVAP